MHLQHLTALLRGVREDGFVSFLRKEGPNLLISSKQAITVSTLTACVDDAATSALETCCYSQAAKRRGTGCLMPASMRSALYGCKPSPLGVRTKSLKLVRYSCRSSILFTQSYSTRQMCEVWGGLCFCMRSALQHIKRVQQLQESAGLPGDWAVITGQQCIADHCPQTQAGNGDCAQQDSIEKMLGSAGCHAWS